VTLGLRREELMPLDETEMREIAQTWIQFHYLSEGSTERNGLFWAYERLDDLVKENPEEAWKVIEVIRRSDRGDMIQSNLAAGPLEDLLCEHGDLFIDRIESAAKTMHHFESCSVQFGKVGWPTPSGRGYRRSPGQRGDSCGSSAGRRRRLGPSPDFPDRFAQGAIPSGNGGLEWTTMN
jgi:hypothetical protein